MQRNIQLATIYALISALAYTLCATIAKQYAHAVAAPTMVFIQFLTSFVLIVLVTLKKGSVVITTLKQSRSKIINLLRTVFGLGIGYFLYPALKFLPLVDGVLLINTAPLWIPFLGAFFFGKRIHASIWIPIIIGFIGVYLVLDPSKNGFNLAALLAIGSALCIGLTSLCAHKASEQGDNGFTLTFYYFFYGTVISGLISIPFWHAVPQMVYWYIIGSGVLFYLMSYTYSMALEYGEASFVVSISYAQVLFAGIISAILYQHFPSWIMCVGLLLIIVGGFLAIQLQKKVA